LQLAAVLYINNSGTIYKKVVPFPIQVYIVCFKIPPSLWGGGDNIGNVIRGKNMKRWKRKRENIKGKEER
jgi:hypothetical protein